MGVRLWALCTLAAGVAAIENLPAPHAPKRPSTALVRDGTSVQVTWAPPLNEGPPIAHYEVQYKESGARVWKDVTGADALDPASDAVLHAGTRQVQVVSTRTDQGTNITQGEFRLSFRAGSLSDADWELRRFTDFMPWNASAAQVKRQLESLYNLVEVKVDRTGPAADGTVSWRVILDWDADFGIGGPTEVRGDVPGLRAVEERGMDGRWSGGGDGRVVVHTLRHGSLTAAACRGRSDGPCTETVDGLLPARSYTFRVRAVSAAGVGDWSYLSDAIRVPDRTSLPQLAAPTLVTAKAGSLQLRVEVAPAAFAAVKRTKEPLAVEVQLRRAGAQTQSTAAGETPIAGLWASVPLVGIPAAHTRAIGAGTAPLQLAVTAHGLAPWAGHQVRARCVTPSRRGPWGGVSPPLWTLPVPPAGPALVWPLRTAANASTSTVTDSARLASVSRLAPTLADVSMDGGDAGADVTPTTVLLRWWPAPTPASPEWWIGAGLALRYDVQHRETGGAWRSVADSWLPGNASAQQLLGTGSVQEVRVEADGGTFRLALFAPLPGVDGEVRVDAKSAPLPVNASAAQVKAAIDALPPLAARGASCDVQPKGPGVFRVQLPRVLGAAPRILADGEALRGERPVAAVTMVREGQLAPQAGDPAAGGPETLGEHRLLRMRVTGLRPLRAHQFRVRTRLVSTTGDESPLGGADVTGPWGATSHVVVTPAPRVEGLRGLAAGLEGRPGAALGDEGGAAPAGSSTEELQASLATGAVSGGALGLLAERAWRRQLSLRSDELPEAQAALAPLEASGSCRVLGGQGAAPHAASRQLPTYQAGVGAGGAAGGSGRPGLCVLVAFRGASLLPAGDGGDPNAPLAKAFSFVDTSQMDPREAVRSARQLYVVPAGSSHVEATCWGGGGGGAAKSDAASAMGGGGAMASARLRVAAGELLVVVVGGGGGAGAGEQPGAGGAPGGGKGGTGPNGAGGGGGGASVVFGRPITDELLSDTAAAAAGPATEAVVPLLVAAGGGGAGSADYCCSGGGPGGSASQAAPAGQWPFATPVNASDPRADPSQQFAPHPPRAEYNDQEQDSEGLPPYHRHLDLGYAPGADLTRSAAPGTGGVVGAGGAGGASGSFALLAVSADDDATNGRWLHGGRGANGMEAGGGGGAGIFGGGGGGAGVDGAGGGGGASYVHWPAVYTPQLAIPVPPAPTVLRAGPQSVSVAWREVLWDSGSASGSAVSRRQPSASYALEIAGAPPSEEFVQVWAGAGRSHAERRTTLTGLVPSTTYQLRLRAGSHRVGLGPASTPVAFTTAPAPYTSNKWSRVVGLPVRRAASAGGFLASPDPPAQAVLGPPPLTGATLVELQGRFLLFGGYSPGVDCSRSIAAPCTADAGVRNALWEFDPVTRLWRVVEATGWPSLPPARHGHSAVVVGGRMYVIGGRGHPDRSGDGGPYHDDVWRLSAGRDRLYAIAGSTEAVTRAGVLDAAVDGVPDTLGGALDLPLQADEDEAGGRSVLVGSSVDTLGFEDLEGEDEEDEECVLSVEVSLTLLHPCPQDLVVSLVGPGPAPRGARGAGWELGASAPGGGRDMEVVLMRGGHGDGANGAEEPGACSAVLAATAAGAGAAASATELSEVEVPLVGAGGSVDDPSGAAFPTLTTSALDGVPYPSLASLGTPASYFAAIDGMPGSSGLLEATETGTGINGSLPGVGTPLFRRHELVFSDGARLGVERCCSSGVDAAEAARRGYGDLYHSPGAELGNDTVTPEAEELLQPRLHSGRFRPLSPLSRFVGLPAAGQWRLRVRDRRRNGVQGRILDWGLRLATSPCERRFRWRRILSGTTRESIRPAASATGQLRPMPRVDASALAIGSSLYYWAGRHAEPARAAAELWRFDTRSAAWSRLRSPPQPGRRLPGSIRPLGRSAVLSPWGVLAFGGRHAGSMALEQQALFRYTPWDRRWGAVPPPASAQDPRWRAAAAFRNEGRPWAVGGFRDADEGAGRELEPPVGEHAMADPSIAQQPSQHLRLDLSGPAAAARHPDPARVGRGSTGAGLPTRRTSGAIAIAGVAGTSSRLRGLASPSLFVFGGTSSIGEQSDLWKFDIRHVPTVAGQGAVADAGRAADGSRGVDAASSLGSDTSPTPADLDGLGNTAWTALDHLFANQAAAPLAAESELQRLGALSDAGSATGGALGSGFLASSYGWSRDLVGGGRAVTSGQTGSGAAVDGVAGPPGGVEAQRDWEAHCLWRLHPRSIARARFVDSCVSSGVTDGSLSPDDLDAAASQLMPCSTDQLLIQAWCRREYQTIGAF